MQDLKKSVREFLTEYKLYDEPLTIKKLEDIIFRQGFEIIYYDALNMSEKVQYLINRLELHNECQSRCGFTYCQKDVKLVFIKQTLNEEDKLSALLHEEVHIYLDHSYRRGFRETSTKQENEVYDFVRLISQERKRRKIIWQLRVLIPLAISLLLIVILIFRKCIPDAPTAEETSVLPQVQTESLTAETSAPEPMHEPESTYESDTTQEPDTTIPQETATTPESASEPAPVTVYVPVYETKSVAEPDSHTYYWTKSGTVYHIYYDCQHLKNSVSVQSGSKSLSGKDRCCKTCYARYVKSATQ